MVTTNLSQNRATQRLLKNRLAVITLARQAAIKTVKRQLQAQGIKSGASFRSLGDPWCDTTSAHGKLMVTALGGLAEVERHLILARTTEGRKRAQARGVRFGRKPKLTVHQQREAVERRARGQPLVDIARSYAVSHSTISRLA
jgi:DNA invertase Pin-like site-specific DNA recombinase